MLKPNFRRIIRHLIKFSKTLSPFSLSHHPECRPFSHHSITVGRRKLCIGCFIGYPTTLVTLFALIIASSFGIRLTFMNAILLGASIEAIAVIIKVLHFSKRVSVRVGSKIIQAAGFGFIFYAPLTLQIPVMSEVFILFLFWTGANGFIGAMRLYETEKTCRACRYKGNWSKCPGFKNIIRRLCKEGFLTKQEGTPHVPSGGKSGP